MSFRERLIIDGQRLDARVDGRITAAHHIRTMEGAASVVLALDDGDGELLNSGLLTRTGKPSRYQQDLDQAAWARFATSRLTLDGWFTRLAGVDFASAANQGSLEVTFEDEIASMMRRVTRAITSSRDTQTRAMFIGMLLGIARQRVGYERYFSPEESVVEHIKAPAGRTKGIHPDKHLTVKGAPADRAQKKLMETVLAEADSLNAGERATLGMLVAAIGESGFATVPNSQGSPYGGVLQGKIRADSQGPAQFAVTDTKGQAHYFLAGGKGYQQGGAIKYAAANPDATSGEIAYKVEGSRSNFPSDQAAEGFYQQWEKEAEAILAAWGGAGQVHVIRERFQYRAGGRHNGKTENYWDASGRLADEVRWRRFADANTLYFITDEWAITQRPQVVLDRGDLHRGAVRQIRATADVGMPVAEIEIVASSARWTIPPAGVVDITGMGPLNGRWLTWANDNDLTIGEATITLHRPAPKLAEPAPATSTVTTTETTPEAGTVRAEIVKQARKALRQQARYRYLQRRPMPSTLFPKVSVELVHIDCSAFATLVYKAAGAPDPNGGGYNGYGWTGTLVANGTKTSDPQPGDLVFYGAGAPYDHVAVYIGDGQVIEMGGTPGPRLEKVKYRSDFAGYWTYDLQQQ